MPDVDEPRPGAEVEVLDPDECRRLLRSTSIGRLATTRPGAAPLVVPVNYAIDDRAVIIRTDPGTKLDLLQLGPVSLQIDAIDPYHRTGWSVLLCGVAHELESTAGVNDPRPWASGAKEHWIRIEPSEITGRRLRLPEIPDLPRDRRGYL